MCSRAIVDVCILSGNISLLGIHIDEIVHAEYTFGVQLIKLHSSEDTCEESKRSKLSFCRHRLNNGRGAEGGLG